MEIRELGTTGIRASRLGLGCATFGRKITQDDAFRIMDAAVERGITLFDTAEAYGGGQAREYRKKYLGVDDQREVSGEMHSSERIVGRWPAVGVFGHEGPHVSLGPRRHLTTLTHRGDASRPSHGSRSKRRALDSSSGAAAPHPAHECY